MPSFPGSEFYGDGGDEDVVQRPQRCGGGSHREFSFLHSGHDGGRYYAADGQRRRLGRVPGVKDSFVGAFDRKQGGVDAGAVALRNGVQADVDSGVRRIGGRGALIESSNVTSPSRSSGTANPRSSSSWRRRRANPSVTSFSASVSLRAAPRSSPPCAGSTTARMR